MDRERWLSLRAACQLLAVNEATVRLWGDSGYLRVYRTPGGHRRFLREDVVRMTQRSTIAARDGSVASLARQDDLEGSALRRIRRRLQQEDIARQPWYQSVDEDGRIRMRLFGRRLLSLLVRENTDGRRRREALSESSMLGFEYGAEMVDRRVQLKDTIEAFIFFRSLVLGSSNPRSWQRMLDLADGVLRGVADAYQRHMPRPNAQGTPP